MGEILKMLGSSNILGLHFELELNKANAENLPESVHIQNSSGRIELSDKEFVKFATTYLSAKKKFEILKEIYE